MKNIFYSLLFLILLVTFQSCQTASQEAENVICQFNVETGNLDRSESVVSVPLDEITFVHDSMLNLFEISENKRVKTDIQFEILGNKKYLYWILTGNTPKGSERQYELVIGNTKSEATQQTVSISSSDGGYEFYFKGKKVLKYNTQIVKPPKGIDESYKRSGFINPLYAPDQTILTRTPDSDSDHLHHYGLWNAWKKVLFKGEEIDFFAPQFGQGTVRHVGVVSRNEGPVYGNLQVLREHITWQNTEKETIAMSDLMDIKVYNNNKNWYIIDLSFQYNPLDTFLIKEYRYAGFSFRATDYWTKENTSIFTSEGLTRDEADSERSRWCMVRGDTPQGTVSMLFMSHPGNYNHPEPMRIWPSDMSNGTGNVFVNYSPTRNTDWMLLPHHSYMLRYRLLISESTLNKNEAENAWLEFSNPIKVKWN
ncbi:MAG: PmoA family protein [Bacteroidales bacterium]|nr:PmoA family protein [Bacteroidales bacterium]